MIRISCWKCKFTNRLVLTCCFVGIVMCLPLYLSTQHPVDITKNELLSKKKAREELDKTGTLEETLKSRLVSVKSRCFEKWRDKLGTNISSYVHFDDGKKMAYCFVAKVGLTYWGRIFGFLTQPEKMKEFNIRSPGKISRLYLHHVKGFRGKVIRARNADQWLNNQTLRFVFSRDPYARLWSCYLDKYFMPCYWLNHQLTSSGLCQYDVTFKIFLEHAVTSDDQHMIPVSLACNPCVFRPDVVGKMETFSEDTEFILEKTNYTYLLKDYDKSSFVEREIRELTQYYFKFFESDIKACFTEQSFAQKIWHLFQYNGYINSSRPFPAGKTSYAYKVSLAMYLDEIKTHPLSKKEAGQQKRRFLVQAYQGIPRSIIAALQARYEPDFELFDYDKNPPS